MVLSLSYIFSSWKRAVKIVVILGPKMVKIRYANLPTSRGNPFLWHILNSIRHSNVERYSNGFHSIWRSI